MKEKVITFINNNYKYYINFYLNDWNFITLKKKNISKSENWTYTYSKINIKIVKRGEKWNEKKYKYKERDERKKKESHK